MFDNRSKKWICRVPFNKKQVYVGLFLTEIEAAMAFDRYIKENNIPIGKIRLNFPIEPEITTPNTRWIYLTQDKWALVDDYNYEWLNQYKWYVKQNKYTYYAERSDSKENNAYISMHREIYGLIDKKIVVDHIDHNGWNNTDNNTRVCTYSQNIHNSRTQINCVSGFKGVWIDKRDGMYYSQITKDGTTITIGRSRSKEECASMYNIAAIKHFGEFAWLNRDENGNIL